MKKRHSFEVGCAVAREIVAALRPACEPDRLRIVGSLRRRRPMVGDVELLYVPRIDIDVDLLGEEMARTDVATKRIDQLISSGVLAKRPNTLGVEMYGPKNKLLVHVATKMPVDLFAADESNWFNLLVCRTGGASTNMEIASRAQVRGLKWSPYSCGFWHEAAELFLPVRSEADVFEKVDMDYQEPWERR